MKQLLLLVPLLCFAVPSEADDVPGWRTIEGEWKNDPVCGQGYLEYQKTIQGKMEITGKIQYDLQTDGVWGFGLYPSDGSFLTVFVEGSSQMTIRLKPKEGATQTLGTTACPRTAKKPVSFRCALAENQILFAVGRAQLKTKLPVSLDGAKVRLCAAGQPATFEKLFVKE
ncbi:MAG: hypothetical protein AB1696_17605 [Planctomycetota bacterium]